MNAPDTAGQSLASIVDALRVSMRESPDSSFVLDRDGIILMANAALCASLGVDESTLIGQSFDLPARSADPQHVLDHFRTARDGTATRYRTTGTRTNGEPFVAEVTQVPIRINDEVVAVLGTALDLTESDRGDAEARQSEELLRLAGRIAHFGGWSVDAQSRTVSMSEGARLMLGLTNVAGDLSEAAWALHPEHERPHVAALLDACLTDGTPFDIESVMNTTSGEQRTVRTVGEAQRLPDGTIIGARGALWDISDTVAARERERALESRLSATLTSISDGIYFLDAENRLTYANPRALEMLRFTEEDLRRTSIWDLFPEAIDTGYRDAFERATTTGEPVTHRAYYEPFDRWFETTAYPTGDGLAVYVRDVTDDQRARETALRTQQQLAQQAALLDSASDAMLVRDIDGTVRYWNSAAAQLYGWSAEEAVGRNIVDLIDMDPAVRWPALETLMNEGYYAGEVAQRTRDGRQIIVDCRWQVLRDDAGEPRSIFAVNTDITEFRTEQDARQRAQRLESLGTLAGGIAHDLNNVLTPVLMSVQLLASDETDQDRAEILATAENAVKRGAEMVRQVLSFARGIEGRRIMVDVDRLLDDMLAFTRDTLPAGIALEIERSAPMPGVVGDPTQLLQVLINLVSNAKDAMGEHGLLRIAAQRLEIVDEYTSVSHSAAPGEYLAIAVEDDGSGMPPEVAEKIFEPFFTTKTPGKGTGLGLATSLTIMRSHGGFMQVYSELGQGTRFVVGLPVAPESATTQPAPSSTHSALPRGEGELVLVVDDEETIRSVTSRTLEVHGYRTLSAANGQEAVALIESGDHDVDLVITDMMMPVMDGAATSAYLEEHHPSIPIIAASGLNSGGKGTRSIGMGIARFLAKPYTTSQLLTSVRDTLLEHRAIDEEPR